MPTAHYICLISLQRADDVGIAKDKRKDVSSLPTPSTFSSSPDIHHLHLASRHLPPAAKPLPHLRQRLIAQARGHHHHHSTSTSNDYGLELVLVLVLVLVVVLVLVLIMVFIIRHMVTSHGHAVTEGPNGHSGHSVTKPSLNPTIPPSHRSHMDNAER